MSLFGDLPTWAVLLLCVLAAAVVIVLNLGWLLSARALLDGQRRKGGPAPEAPAAKSDDPPRGPGR
jgi:hypothetical protein